MAAMAFVIAPALGLHSPLGANRIATAWRDAARLAGMTLLLTFAPYCAPNQLRG